MQIGNYEIVEQIGAGAMGVVYKAQHSRVRRGHLFAIKLMNSVIADRPDLVARFHREIEVVGRLEHPNIVNVVDAGEHQGSPYLVMEYLQGEPLEKYIAERRPVPFAKKLEIMAAVCHGLDYAHNQGVVHRDVKPANIILLPDLTPRIVDFGVAHIADNTVTKTGMIVGTISYMSPEQLNGSRVDGRTDVFSAAIVLYEFLSSHLPFEGADTAAIMKKILLDAPPPLRNFVQPCPFQVEAILAKGLAKDAAYRYSAREMATELDKLQETELVMEAAADAAMQATVLTPAARVQPKPAEAPPPQAPAADSQATTVNLSEVAAQVPAEEITEVLEKRVPALAANTVQSSEQKVARVLKQPISPLPATAIQTSTQAPGAVGAQPALASPGKIAGSAPASGEIPVPKRRPRKWGLISGALIVLLAAVAAYLYWKQPAGLRILGDEGGWVSSIAFSPDGRYLASGGTDDRVLLWDIASGRVEHSFEVKEGAESVAFSPDGQYLAAQSGKGFIKILDPVHGSELHTFSDGTFTFGVVAFSADSKYVATEAGQTIRLVDVATGNTTLVYLGHSDTVRAIAFSPDGRYLASGSNDTTVKLWTMTSSIAIRTLTGHTSQVWTVAFSPDTHYLASGDDAATVKLWEVSSGTLVRSVTVPDGLAIESLAFSPDGRSLAAACLGAPIQIWDVATGQLLRSMGNKKKSEGHIAFSPDGHYLASGGTDQKVKLWDLTR